VKLVSLRTSAIPGLWTAQELAELMRLYAALAAMRGATAWDVWCTENGDPQFGVSSEAECLCCVSRIGRGERTYVAQDERGAVLADGNSLAEVVDASVPRPRRSGLRLVVSTLAGLRAAAEEEVFAAIEAVKDLALVLPQAIA
jgi:hypothetical protein